ncbi:hypothetical protein D3C75_469130 [compost metagenome]
MDACALHMLHDARNNNRFTVADRVNLNLFAEHVTVNQHRMLRIDFDRFNHVGHQFIVVIHDLHRTSAQYVRWTHQHRIAEGLGCFYCLACIGYCLAFRLCDIQTGQQCFEPLAVFSFVDARQAGSEDVHTGCRQRRSKVDGRLAAELHDNPDRILLGNDVHYIFKEQRFKIQPVRRIEIRRHRLRVVVDNNGLIAGVLDRPYRVNSGVVELNPLADTDRARAEYYNLLLVGMNNFVFCFISRVVVRCRCFEFSRTRIYHLEDRCQALGKTQAADIRFLRLSTAWTPFGADLGDCTVSEAFALSLIQRFSTQCLFAAQHILELHQSFNLGQEPPVYIRNILDLLQLIAAAVSFGDQEQALIVRLSQTVTQHTVFQQLGARQTEAVNSDLQRTDCLVDRLFKGTANRHYFAGRFHLCTQLTVRRGELVERPARDFADDIIQRRLEAGIRLSGNRINDFVERVAEGDFGCHLSDWIASCLGSKRRRAADTRIHFDYIILIALRIKRELYVTAAFDIQRTDDLQRSAAQHLVFTVGERLARCYNDTVASMYTYRVKVLHVADNDTVVICVTHNFVFYFLHARDALFDQTLADRAVADTRFDRLTQLFRIITDTAACSAERISRTYDQREADFFGEAHRFIYSSNNNAFRNRLIQLAHQFAEQITVFCLLDRVQLSTEQLHVLCFQYAGTRQLNRHIQTCLAAECREQSVGTLLADNTCYELKGDWLNVDLISHVGISHNGGRVAVDQHNLHAFFFQRLAGLCTCIVELGGLANDDWTGADHEDFFEFIILRHNYRAPFTASSFGVCLGAVILALAASCAWREPAGVFALWSAIICRKRSNR